MTPQDIFENLEYLLSLGRNGQPLDIRARAALVAIIDWIAERAPYKTPLPRGYSIRYSLRSGGIRPFHKLIKAAAGNRQGLWIDTQDLESTDPRDVAVFAQDIVTGVLLEFAHFLRDNLPAQELENQGQPLQEYSQEALRAQVFELASVPANLENLGAYSKELQDEARRRQEQEAEDNKRVRGNAHNPFEDLFTELAANLLVYATWGIVGGLVIALVGGGAWVFYSFRHAPEVLTPQGGMPPTVLLASNGAPSGNASDSPGNPPGAGMSGGASPQSGASDAAGASGSGPNPPTSAPGTPGAGGGAGSPGTSGSGSAAAPGPAKSILSEAQEKQALQQASQALAQAEKAGNAQAAARAAQAEADHALSAAEKSGASEAEAKQQAEKTVQKSLDAGESDVAAQRQAMQDVNEALKDQGIQAAGGAGAPAATPGAAQPGATAPQPGNGANAGAPAGPKPGAGSAPQAPSGAQPASRTVGSPKNPSAVPSPSPRPAAAAQVEAQRIAYSMAHLPPNLKKLWIQGANAKHRGDYAGAKRAWGMALKIDPGHYGFQESIDKLPKM